MKGLLTLILILFFGTAYAETVPASAVSPSITSASDNAPSFAGTYHCKGHDPYLNKDYSGTVEITPQNTVYNLVMKYDLDTEVDHGTGGMYDKTLLSVVFQNEKDLKKVGLEQYHLSDDLSQISGFWVYLGHDKLGTEICTRDVPKTADAKTK
jgi:hypothetical protein